MNDRVMDKALKPDYWVHDLLEKEDLKKKSQRRR